jgi:DNA-binding YbaB/EbfC family protein
MFGNLGEMAGLMKKASQIQDNMKKMKEEMANVEVSGQSGGGQVEVLASGDFKIKKIIVKPECVNAEDTELLEDLILSAVNNALDAAKLKAQEEMNKVTGGINIPGLF